MRLKRTLNAANQHVIAGDHPTAEIGLFWRDDFLWRRNIGQKSERGVICATLDYSPRLAALGGEAGANAWLRHNAPLEQHETR
jgi:hypothetical protein